MTIKKTIITLLQTNGPMFKGVIEDKVRESNRVMGDTTSRRLRELTKAEIIKKEIVDGNTVYVLIEKHIPKPVYLNPNTIRLE